MPPPPLKWKGKCNLPPHVCNNKLIGARWFGGESAVDKVGHGSHTASTAGGNFVQGANFFGNANGTAAGIAPHAHVAMYQVCGPSICDESNILAGMDAAISDGVDVISVSLGGPAVPYHLDHIAIGAYKAMEKGIFVSCSAGNEGPLRLSNGSPWVLTVGASTHDRSLRVEVLLGNNVKLSGQSGNQPKDWLPKKELDIVSPGEDPFCDDLEGKHVKGKIVVCESGGETGGVQKGETVRSHGGAAMILINDESSGDTTFVEAHVLPAANINYGHGVKLKAYLNSTARPTAKISFLGTVIGDKHVPIVPAFSSRGPSSTSPGILKPDIIGPGVNILAAWPFPVNNETKPKFSFNMISGTSMSCPHLSGVAALLKSAHPDWSPAAIKSAIVTTADHLNLNGKPILDETLRPASIFATGSGHVNPSRASDPGLIYDIRPNDYILYLCGLNYTSKQVSVIVQKQVQCSGKQIPEAQLNYPSFSIKFGLSPQSYTRTMTNVGEANSAYDVKIVAPAGVTVNVQPAKLQFSKVGQKLTYNVTFTRTAVEVKGHYCQGEISWNSAKHAVRSPIAVQF